MDKMFPPLNLPAFDIKAARDADGCAVFYDPLRQKHVAATPEEWVRQHFVNYLTAVLGFPRSFIANEQGVKLNGRTKRCDTIVYTPSLKPLCIVEYKRPDVELTGSVFDQIARYNSALEAKYLIVSNGMKHYCCRFDGTSYSFLRAIPTYAKMLGEEQK